MLYTLNLYSVVCQLSLKSLEGKKSTLYQVLSWKDVDVKGKRRIEREKKDLSFTGQMEHRSKRAISKLYFFFFFNFMTLTTLGNNQGPLMGEWPRTL